VGPDYALMRLLFHSQGRIIPPKEDTDGVITAMNVDEFIAVFDPKLRDGGVIASGGMEREVGRTKSEFHRVASVRSAYHFYVPEWATPVARGSNFFQLIHDEDRWWILNLTWDRVQGAFSVHQDATSEPSTHYKLLMVSSTADAEKIRFAYRLLAEVYHPDN